MNKLSIRQWALKTWPDLKYKARTAARAAKKINIGEYTAKGKMLTKDEWQLVRTECEREKPTWYKSKKENR